MDREDILENILEEYRTAVEESKVIQQVRGKIASGAAMTYADAQDAAIETGKAVSGAIRNHLPDAVTEDRLARETAEVIVKKPMIEAGTDLSEIAKGVQESLNENADLGLDAIVPELNEDQIDGIISGICNAEDYRDRLESFMDGVENFYEGVVDDFVHDNAQFQYEAGLSPVIERIPVGKCCKWCSNLAGKYPYEKVRDTGNDVFRRHKNCHCQVIYNPGDGSKKRQDVHSKEWTDVDKDDMIKRNRESASEPVHRKIKNSDLPNGLPRKSTPNSISDKIDDDGKVLQRRLYGNDGMAKVDYDTTDHHRPDQHPEGIHKHTFDYTKEKPRSKPLPVTEKEKQENADIIPEKENEKEND